MTIGLAEHTNSNRRSSEKFENFLWARSEKYFGGHGTTSSLSDHNRHMFPNHIVLPIHRKVG